MADRKPHAVDIHVGTRLRELRSQADLSQTALGDSAGVTFQQIQKYENGSNRIAASRLWDFAAFLHAPVESFFPGHAGSLSACSHDPAFAQWASLYHKTPPERRAALIRIVRLMIKENL